ncbi:MAG: hypothetical protein JWO19_3938 [Bryobacterales bacterium]|nr:hypothetical protein [Bryobacterales bacterium]
MITIYGTGLGPYTRSVPDASLAEALLHGRRRNLLSRSAWDRLWRGSLCGRIAADCQRRHRVECQDSGGSISRPVERDTPIVHEYRRRAEFRHNGNPDRGDQVGPKALLPPERCVMSTPAIVVGITGL